MVRAEISVFDQHSSNHRVVWQVVLLTTTAQLEPRCVTCWANELYLPSGNSHVQRSLSLFGGGGFPSVNETCSKMLEKLGKLPCMWEAHICREVLWVIIISIPLSRHSPLLRHLMFVVNKISIDTLARTATVSNFRVRIIFFRSKKQSCHSL